MRARFTYEGGLPAGQPGDQVDVWQEGQDLLLQRVPMSSAWTARIPISEILELNIPESNNPTRLAIILRDGTQLQLRGQPIAARWLQTNIEASLHHPNGPTDATQWLSALEQLESLKASNLLSVETFESAKRELLMFGTKDNSAPHPEPTKTNQPEVTTRRQNLFGWPTWAWILVTLSALGALIVLAGLTAGDNQSATTPEHQSPRATQPTPHGTTSPASAAQPISPSSQPSTAKAGKTTAPVTSSPLPIEAQLEQSIRDNSHEVSPNAVMDGLRLSFEGGTGVLSLAIKPTEPRSLPGYLTYASSLSIDAGRAVWSSYPMVQQIRIYVRRDFKEPDGVKRDEIGVYLAFDRGTGTKLNYNDLRNQPDDDNKSMLCRATEYDLAPDIYDALGDKGCLTRRSMPSDGPVFAQLPRIGQAVGLKEDGWRITVTSVSKVSSVHDLFDTHEALGVYLVVHLTIENVSSGTQALCGDRFHLIDDFGRTYDYYEVGTKAFGSGELCSDINAGLRAPIVLLFDVPTDDTGVIVKSLGGFRARIGSVAAVVSGP